MINMDMIGNKDSVVNISGVGTSPVFRPLLDSLKFMHPLKLTLSDAGLGQAIMLLFTQKKYPFYFSFLVFMMNTIRLKIHGKRLI